MATPTADTYSAPTGRTSMQAGRGTPYVPNAVFRIRRGGVIQSPGYATMAACSGAVVSGDTILVAGGNYVSTASSNILAGAPDVAVLTIEWDGTGTKPFFDIAAAGQFQAENGGAQAGFVMGPSATDWTIRNINTFGWRAQGNHVSSGFYLLPGYGQPGGTQAAILRIIGCTVEQWTNGLLFGGSNSQFEIEIENCVFRDNSADTLSHHIYAGKLKQITIRGSRFTNTTAMAEPGGEQFQRGHLIKSRAIATIVQGNLLEGNYGSARVCDISNGGAFEFTGNLVLDYPHNTRALDNQCIAYGLESQSVYTPNPSESTPHTINTILLAQNTIRKEQAQPLLDQPYEILRTVQMVDANGTPIPAPVVTARGNIVAAYLNAAATNFVNAYPANTEVAFGTISNTGIYSGTPATSLYADAPWAYQGDYLPALPRTDMKYGGSGVAIPSWATSAAATPNAWVAIPNTRLATLFPDAGGTDALGNAIPAAEPAFGGRNSYDQTWAFGGPAYSRARKEVYCHGSGHFAGSMNHVVAIRIGKDTPDGIMLSPSSSAAVRAVEYQSVESLKPYHSDGKPLGSHTYQNLVYSENTGEMVMMSIANTNAPTIGVWGALDTAGFARSSGIDLGGNGLWQAAKTWPDMHAGGNDNMTALSLDGNKVYYSFSNSDTRLRCLNLQTRAISIITSYSIDWNTYAFGVVRPLGAGAEGSLIYMSGHGTAAVGGGSVWYVRKIDLTSGALSVVTVSGVSATGHGQCNGWYWSEAGGFYIGVFISQGQPNTVVKFTPTNAEHTLMTAAAITTTGTAPTASGLRRSGFFDPDYGVLIVCDDALQNMKAIKVA